MSRILIRGGCVLTLGARTPNFAEADVLITDGRIEEVGPGLRARDAETIDATDAIVMPGFVDTHRHAWKSLFRNFGERGPSEGTLHPSVYGPHHGPDDVYAATLIGLLGAVEAGITTVVDWADIPVGAGFTDAALQAHADAGLRTVFVHARAGWSADQVTTAPGDPILTAPEGSLTSFAYGPDDPAGSDLDDVAAEWEAARAAGLRIHAHVGTDKENHGVVAALGGRGLLGEDVTLVHCSSLDRAGLDAIASSRAMVSLSPSSEMAGGLGLPPIQELIDRSIRPGLGVDNERVAPGDMFAQMRAANSLQHATLFDLKLAGKAGVPNLLSTRQVIRYATVDGARVAGLGATTGSLEAGKQGDVVVLRTDRPNIAPVNDPIGAVVWGMDTSNVDWVFAAGRPLMREGVLQADVTRARDLAMAAQRRVAGASGLLATVGGEAR